MVGGGRPLLAEILGPCWSESTNFQLMFTRSASAITHSKKSSVVLNRKSTTSSPMSLRWVSYVEAPKGGSKTQNGHFPSRIALHWKKVCYKVSLCEYCQRQRCKAFTGLSLRAESVHGGHPVLCEKLDETEQPPSKMPISNQYSLIAPQP